MPNYRDYCVNQGLAKRGFRQGPKGLRQTPIGHWRFSEPLNKYVQPINDIESGVIEVK